MKAILLKSPGDFHQLYLGECETPKMEANEVLIKVYAAGVNRADILQREGKYPSPPGASEILGLEVSGIVEKVGASCTRFSPGDRVMALLVGGGYAQYVSVDEILVMPVPGDMSFEEAASIPEAYITAYQVLCEIAKLKAGEWALIHAGASGVGSAGIQLCKAIGARSVVTVGTDLKAEYCKKLGANYSINYRSQPDWYMRVKEITEGQGADVIIDPIGATYFHHNLNIAAIDGRWILIAAMGGAKVTDVNLAKLLMKRINLIGSTLRSRDLNYKSKLINQFSSDFLSKFDSGELFTQVDRIFNPNQVAEAHRFMEENRNMGKIVLAGFNQL